ncbi:MAG: AAA family ATPase, partial [Cetobacterium somerae]|uniref:AAA family ATPase n=1 Tax=Cetobacterium somerae TaxID=188913 RepID=UPI003F39E032
FFLKKECNNINITNNKERFIDNYLTYNININFKEIIDEYLIISEKNNAKDILKSIELSPILISDISNPEKLKELKDKLINQNSNEKKEEILEKTWSFLKNIKYLKNDMLNKYYENIVNQNFEKIKEFLKFIQNLDDQFFIDENTISFNFTQSYSENQQNKILNILKWINKLPDQNSENYEMLERITNFFYSTLEGLSDGEKMYVNIFSSIRKLISEEILSSIVLLDEVELYLHPEWMRRILNMYIKHLSKIKNHKFQLIFATHSPFIISDLPKECVILLEKGVLGTESKKCEIKTFGANIFDLYSETFFLSSTFGEFATKKIVEILNMEEITKENEEVIDYIVDSVGEKLIRSQLKKLLENKKRI